MIRSWSTYQKDPLFDSAFALLMEFFQAYTTGDNQEVIYEINLAKLNFTVITKSLVDFFHSIGFIITAKYLDNKINSLDKNNLGKPKKLGPIRSNPVTVKKGI